MVNDRICLACRRLVVVGVSTICIALAGCGEQANEPGEPASDPGHHQVGQAHTIDPNGEPDALPELKPFIGVKCLQIDRRDPDSLDDPGDANLKLAKDVDGSASYFEPAGCSDSAPTDDNDNSVDTSDFVDWNELDFGANALDLSQFQLKDALSDKGDKDPTAFPSSDNEVGEASVVPKQDLVEAAIAVNELDEQTDPTVVAPFINIGLLRGGTEGSSSWFAVFSVVEPHIHPGEGKDADKRFLTYDINPGDVLVVGDFDPAKGDNLAVHLAAVDVDGLSAVEVASPEGQTPGGTDIWGPRVTDPSIIGALNTTPTGKGQAGELFDGTDDDGTPIADNRLTKEGWFDAGAFFEASIPLEVFTGNSTCGNVFYGSFITRPSRSRASDMKDLLGIFQLNLGAVSPNPTLTPTCDGDLQFSASPQVTGLPGSGGTLTNPSCSWTITCGGTEVLTDYTNDCSSDVLSTAIDSQSSASNPFPLDSTDSSSSCTADVTASSPDFVGCTGDATATESILPPLDATATLTPACEDPDGSGADVSKFSFAASNITGGSGTNTISWTFSPSSDASPSQSSDATGTVDVASAGANTIYTGTLKVVDSALNSATGDTCDITRTDEAIPLAPLAVGLKLSNSAGQCVNSLTQTDTSTTDAATYQASYSGGLGAYTVSWNETPDLSACTDIAASSPDTGGSASCTIDPAAANLCGSLSLTATVDDVDPDTAPSPETCLEDIECSASGDICVDGVCETLCTSTSDCASGEYCESASSFCRDIDAIRASCPADTSDAGLYLKQTTILSGVGECLVDADCASGETCSNANSCIDAN